MKGSRQTLARKLPILMRLPCQNDEGNADKGEPRPIHQKIPRRYSQRRRKAEIFMSFYSPVNAILCISGRGFPWRILSADKRW